MSAHVAITDSANRIGCPAHACSQTPNFAPYYSYDGEDKMTAAGGSAYFCDGEGRRVKKVVGGLTTVLVYDAGGRLVAEYGGAASQTSGTGYVTQDMLGSTRVVTGQGGEVRGRYDYLPFGEEVYIGRQGYGGEDIRQRFTSKERDEETGLDYFVNCYYSSAQGRFTSYDPLFINARRLVDPQRLNVYAYSRNNPLRYIDPDGLNLLIAAKTEEEAQRKYDLFQKGLNKDDRQHAHFVVGDGKNGFAKGTYAVTIDKDYKSDSENFQTAQKIANAKDTEMLNIIGPKNSVTVLQAVKIRMAVLPSCVSAA